MERHVTMTIIVALIVAHAVTTVTQEVQELDVARNFVNCFLSFAKDNNVFDVIVLRFKIISKEITNQAFIIAICFITQLVMGSLLV